MSRRLRLTLLLSLPLAGFLILLVLLLLGLGSDPRLLPSALVDQPLPDFSMGTLVEAEGIKTPADLAGEVALLNVWGTWCPACRQEHEVLVDIAGRGMPIYGVNYKDQRASALEWLDHLGNPYRFSLYDREGRLGLDLGVYGAPETYLLDRRGVIRYRHVGVLDEQVWQAEFEPRIRLLEQGG